MSEKRDMLKAGWIDILRASVFAQENGVAVGEVLAEVFGLSGMHAVAVSIHNERLKMLHEGIKLQVPPEGRNFILGLPDEGAPATLSTDGK